MSKVIEALEKARREGQLESLVEPVSERSTLSGQTSRPMPRKPAVVDVRTPRPMDRGAGVAKSLPSSERLAGLDPHLEPLHNPMSVVCEQYRSLRNRIERETASGAQVLAITSCSKGEGKSLSATNLALVMSQDVSKRVLLVDADLRRPMIHQLLGLPRSPGLSELLDQGGEARVQETPFFGLCAVTAGEAEGHPSELLAGDVFRRFLGEHRRDFDHIIVDTPPLNPISDVAFLAEAVDGVILVVHARKTDKGLLQRSIAGLPDGKVIGSILNRSDQSQDGYGKGPDGYYRGYY